MNATQLPLLTGRQFVKLANDTILHRGEVGVPYQSGYETSKVAAEKIAPKVSRLEGYVIDALARFPDGLTDEQIDAEVERFELIEISTLRPRRIALSEPKYQEGPKGHEWQYRTMIRPKLVEPSGEKRLTRFGNKAVVHRLTLAGRLAAEARA